MGRNPLIDFRNFFALKAQLDAYVITREQKRLIQENFVQTRDWS
jgi:hypothetical protein